MRISEKTHLPLGRREGEKTGQEMRTKLYPHSQYQRIQAKSLKNMLPHKFLNEYEHEKGKITASAIVEDIISLVKSYFKKVDTLGPDKLIYLASALDDVFKRGKRIQDTQMIPDSPSQASIGLFVIIFRSYCLPFH